MHAQEPLRIKVPKRLAGTRFDRVLVELIPDESGAQLQKLVRRGKVKVDGKKVVRSNFRVRGGEALLVHLPATPPPPLNVLHQDADVIVIDKPPGMMTHPADRVAPGGSVSELAVERFGRLPSFEDDEEVRPGVVHRLDRETSGVIVLARTEEALESLRAQFRERTVEKRYLALVHGSPRDDRFEVDGPLGPAPGHADRQRVHPSGREAFTAFEVLRRWSEYALVECRPRTGRRHQIRVHLDSLGHPVVGDKIYRAARGKEAELPHQALHAARLAFDHPANGERVTFEAPPPATLQRFLDSL